MYQAKINLADQVRHADHRSGWGFALDALQPLHNPSGCIFHGYLEKPFVWEGRDNIRKQLIPLKQPWCGFLHGADVHPRWFSSSCSISSVFNSLAFRESLKRCYGLFVMSETAANRVRHRLGIRKIPVSVLRHPTETPEVKFTWAKWEANPDKRILQLGWYLRRLNSIYELKVDNYKKTHLMTGSSHAVNVWRKERQMLERQGKPVIEHGVTEQVGFLPNAEYDEYLSRNIAFVHLYAANANNAVIECIVRATPLLVNPLPAVKEYLGPKYPLYFDTLDHAAKLAKDTGAIKEAHLYLREAPILTQLTAQHFLDSFHNSSVYGNLPCT